MGKLFVFLIFFPFNHVISQVYVDSINNSNIYIQAICLLIDDEFEKSNIYSDYYISDTLFVVFPEGGELDSGTYNYRGVTLIPISLYDIVTKYKKSKRFFFINITAPRAIKSGEYVVSCVHGSYTKKKKAFSFTSHAFRVKLYWNDSMGRLQVKKY